MTVYKHSLLKSVFSYNLEYIPQDSDNTQVNYNILFK